MHEKVASVAMVQLLGLAMLMGGLLILAYSHRRAHHHGTACI
jgi:hypothetical protein